MRIDHATIAPRTSASLGATRTVRIRRWVPSDQIERDMYVIELDRPWLETPFMFQGFRIDSLETLAAVREACDQALVETEKLTTVA